MKSSCDQNGLSLAACFHTASDIFKKGLLTFLRQAVKFHGIIKKGTGSARDRFRRNGAKPCQSLPHHGWLQIFRFRRNFFIIIPGKFKNKQFFKKGEVFHKTDKLAFRIVFCQGGKQIVRKPVYFLEKRGRIHLRLKNQILRQKREVGIVFEGESMGRGSIVKLFKEIPRRTRGAARSNNTLKLFGKGCAFLESAQKSGELLRFSSGCHAVDFGLNVFKPDETKRLRKLFLIFRIMQIQIDIFSSLPVKKGRVTDNVPLFLKFPPGAHGLEKRGGKYFAC